MKTSVCDLAAAHRELWRAQDEFYRCMTKWIVSEREVDGGRVCYKFALAYQHAIDRYLVFLRSESPTADVARAKRAAIEWKSILSADLSYLSQFRLANPDLIPDGANGHHTSG